MVKRIFIEKKVFKQNGTICLAKKLQPFANTNCGGCFYWQRNFTDISLHAKVEVKHEHKQQ